MLVSSKPGRSRTVDAILIVAVCVDGGGSRLRIQNHSERKMLCSITVILLTTGKRSNYNQQQLNKDNNGDCFGCTGKLWMLG